MVSDPAAELVSLMKGRSVTVATAESLTGGGVGAALTAVPGSSAVYRGGVVAYTGHVKVAVLGVEEELLEPGGAVSELVALQMALGAQAICDADWAVATTGVAGPGDAAGVAAGTVWFAVVGPGMGVSEGARHTELKHFDGDREAVRTAAVQHALAMLLRVQ